MNLREEIAKKYSKAGCDRIVAWIGDDQKRFDELFKLFTSDEYRIVQTASGPLSYCVKECPRLIKKHFASLIKNVQKPAANGAVKRNTVRLLQFTEIPEKYQGDVMNICFEFIQSITEKVAVKAFSLTVLQNLSAQYPEIVPEIKLIIDERMPHETVAFKNRAQRFLKITSAKILY